MENLFNKAAIFTDLHFGKKNNDRQFNIDCENFIKWFISIAKEHEVDCIIFLGDWHDNRNSIHISTLNYSLSGFEALDDLDMPVYFIPGNHDEMYKEKRELTSISIGRNLKNIKLMNEFTTMGNVTFCPWLVGEEWKQIKNLAKKSTYMFGHFELPHFMMNAMVEMPDDGRLNYEHFEAVKEWAFTGHFHKRQSKGKVVYMGNTFPHNYSDVWDDERGMMILDWGQTPQFIKWPDAPCYRTFKLSELLDNPEDSLNHLTYARVATDLMMSHDDVQLIKDIFQTHYNPRKLDMIPLHVQDDDNDFDDSVSFQSIDQIVVEGLKNIESVAMDTKVLMDIYANL